MAFINKYCYNIFVKKGFILLFVFLFFLYSNKIFADTFDFSKSFGGKITSTKANEIQELEGAGFECVVMGTTISIKPIGSPTNTPTSYYIPSWVKSKTRTEPNENKLILGKYGISTPITCVRFEEVQVVNLKTITLFGTSR